MWYRDKLDGFITSLACMSQRENMTTSISIGLAPSHYTWWRHQMETFSALLALCAGNSPVAGEFPAQRPVTRSFDVSFDLRLNKQFSKQSWGWWFEAPSHSLWSHCNDEALFGIVEGNKTLTRDFSTFITAMRWWFKERCHSLKMSTRKNTIVVIHTSIEFYAKCVKIPVRA